ncbi:hypothetical protein F9L16_24080 [Agarivorans sp. B2Z047]|uniref:hypothetical protein n=1 Tax=Agarivorans sp. B2Z047 TaxID=2652721 RepID=UPI00128B2B5E|nr:hypothetical protein [Agarivorans sp. B2Z047]MPW32027.1 hypothetical protein [Agarivorans sp. B2Z047]UQN43689.1 hypothetical protein LQZ07_04220 [Agarivorans sp. B2Z047]
MSNGSIKVLPDQHVTFKTQEEVDNANKLYAFIVQQKEKDHLSCERRERRPMKRKTYSGSRFLKDVFMHSVDEIEGGE